MSTNAFRLAAKQAAQDQARAAARDTRTLVRTVAASLSAPAIPTPPGVAHWLASAVLDAARAGRLHPCPHLGPSPAPAFGVWVAPGVGRVGCATCQTEVTAALSGTVSDHSCDRCNYEVGQAEPWSRLLVPLGPVLWTVGFCDRCGTDLNLNLDTKANRHA